MTRSRRRPPNRAGPWPRILAEALPFIQSYDRETVVIKYGGHAMGEEETAPRCSPPTSCC